MSAKHALAPWINVKVVMMEIICQGTHAKNVVIMIYLVKTARAVVSHYLIV